MVQYIDNNILPMVVFRKLRKGGGAYPHSKVGGSGGMLPQEIKKKRRALRSILVHFWPCITCIIYQFQVLYISENLEGGGPKVTKGGQRLPREDKCPLSPSPKCNPATLCSSHTSKPVTIVLPYLL